MSDFPFSYAVKVGHISANAVTVTLEANEKERAELARLWKILGVNKLVAELQISRWKKDGVRLRGVVDAEVSQACVVTLEPVIDNIHEEIEQIFVPEGSRLARLVLDERGEMVLDPEGDDIPETFTGDTVDAGAVICEAIALALNPYPRKEGVNFNGHIESTEKDDKKPSPFAVLKDWKKD